ncbi:THAP domain-containing protein 9, partial [Caligus rogercresseyi]
EVTIKNGTETNLAALREIMEKYGSLVKKMATCAVAACFSPHMDSDGGYSYHRFPKRMDLQQKWVHACHREDPISLGTARICSRHFEFECFEINLKAELMPNYGRASSSKIRRKLKIDATPTHNLAHETPEVRQSVDLRRKR